MNDHERCHDNDRSINSILKPYSRTKVSLNYFRNNVDGKLYRGVVTSVDTVMRDEDDVAQEQPFEGLETDLDDESFRSDLERDSAHSSLVNQVARNVY